MTNETQFFQCKQCGANLKYKPGTQLLSCEHCGAENEIESEIEVPRSLDYKTLLKQLEEPEESLELNMVDCQTCGATSSVENNIKSANCPYCHTPFVLNNASVRHFLKPKYILPFSLTIDDAKGILKNWVKKFWLAPPALKKHVLHPNQFKGLYLPYWIFDSKTVTRYSGKRGEHYWETESYSTRENGKWVQKSRSVRKTRWYSASGTVRRYFENILIAASNSLSRKYVRRLEPWDLENLTPFEPEYLSGFVTEKYQIDLENGFDMAREKCIPVIKTLVRRDIGGDEQRIHEMDTQHHKVKFKHVLLPVYVTHFKLKEKTYQFIVNARTGEIQGKRPIHVLKLVLVVLGFVVLAVLIYLIMVLINS